MYIGTRLRKLRDRQRVSTREIADRIGVSQSTYVGWENDKSSPTVRVYMRIAEAFEMDPVQLMTYLTS